MPLQALRHYTFLRIKYLGIAGPGRPQALRRRARHRLLGAVAAFFNSAVNAIKALRRAVAASDRSPDSSNQSSSSLTAR